MKNTMQINYWTIGGFEGEMPIPTVLEKAAKMGYEGVELTFGAGCFAPGITEAECKEIKACAKSLGLKIDSLASGAYWGMSMTDPRAPVRKKAVAFTKEYLQVAKWLGVKQVLVIPGHVAVPWDPSQKIIPYQDAWKNATASVRACLPTATKLGVSMGLENVWNWFLSNDPMAMKTFVDQFKSPRVGVYFDVANCLLNGYPEHWIEILGKRIKAVHFKNFNRFDCGGILHGFGDDLLKGDVNFPAVIKALKKIKYTGPITAEMIPFVRLPFGKIPAGIPLKDAMPKRVPPLAPDEKLARKTATQMKKLLGKR